MRKNAPTLYRLRTLSSSTATGSERMPLVQRAGGGCLKRNAIHRAAKYSSMARDATLKVRIAMLSIVIPIHNEEPSILPLYDRLTAVLEQLQRPYEILFVDDASNDRSFELLANLVETDGHLKVIRLRRNFGQTAALSAGFHEAKGDVIIAMDGDLQHAPEDIPALLREDRRGLRYRQRLAQESRGQRHHAQDSVAHRQLADGQGVAASTCAISAPRSRRIAPRC